jgi:hypothetical protein
MTYLVQNSKAVVYFLKIKYLGDFLPKSYLHVKHVKIIVDKFQFIVYNLDTEKERNTKK